MLRRNEKEKREEKKEEKDILQRDVRGRLSLLLYIASKFFDLLRLDFHSAGQDIDIQLMYIEGRR